MDGYLTTISEDALERLVALRDYLILTGVSEDITIGEVASALICQVDLEGID